MFKLAIRLSPRLLKARSSILLLTALIFATAVISSITLFVNRIENSLASEAASFIAADAKIQGTLEINPDWRALCLLHAESCAEYQSFSAMLFSESGLQLAQVKAVSDSYPLRGNIKLSLPTSSVTQSLDSGPPQGEIWLARRLFQTLEITAGDSIRLGEAEFTATRAIVQEPDSPQSLFGVAPRAMINLEDINATGAIQQGSRVTHALLMRGDADQLSEIKNRAQGEFGDHFRWVNPEEGNAAVDSSVSRAKKFLLIAGSLSVLLSGLAIALSARRFAMKQASQVAILKTLGITPAQIQSLYSLFLFFIGAIGVFFGAALGWLMHYVIIEALGDLLPASLGGFYIEAFYLGALTSFATLAAFAAPPLLQLKSLAPSVILKNHKHVTQHPGISIIIGCLSGLAMILFYSNSVPITLTLGLGIFICVLFSTLSSFLFLYGLKLLNSRTRSYWRLGMANLRRNTSHTALQIFVFASVGMLILILYELRTGLINDWKPSLEKAPNHFVFNIFGDELESIKTAFEQNDIVTSSFYPMSRGRVISVNNIPIEERIIPEKQRTNYERELNLTWSRSLGEDNSIIAGKWWSADQNDTLLVSAEKDYAEGLDLKLGDVLTFSIAGQSFTAELKSIRQVQWDSMNPNFYMIFDQAIGNGFSENWITSFYLAPDEKAFVNQLLAQFPTISLIELDQTLALVKDVSKKLSLAVEFILFLVLAAGCLVLISSTLSTIDERTQESALLRSFGAPRSFLQRLLFVEFGLVGLCAGVFACIGGQLSLYYIQAKVFEMPYTPHLWLIVLTPFISVIMVTAVGYASTIGTTFIAPMKTLRQVEN